MEANNNQPLLDTKAAAVAGVNQQVRAQLMMLLSRSGLPRKLVDRLLHDVDGRPHYDRVESLDKLHAVAPNSTYWGTSCLCTCCCCNEGVLVQQGTLGKLKANDEFLFLAPGYHAYTSFGNEYLGEVNTNVVNQAVVHGSAGFVTVTEGRIGVLLVGAEYRLLAPGTFQWNSPACTFLHCVDVTAAVAKLGPFTLVTIPDGMVSITYHNGDLRVMGFKAPAANSSSTAAVGGKEIASGVPMLSGGGGNDDDAAVPASSAKPAMTRAFSASHGASSGAPQAVPAAQRTFFLDDPKWLHSCFLSLKTQTDRLEGNDLLSRDNVEILMVAMSEWRIIDPVLAVNECADDMESIRVKVNQLVRATIARIVAGTNIGAGDVGGVANKRGQRNNNNQQGDDQQQQQKKPEDDANLSHLMQSEQATGHMRDLSHNLRSQGIEVIGVYVPEKRMKNQDIRIEVAKQAVIGIQAEAQMRAADATAYATTTAAKAEAEAIHELAKAHAEAGKRLGAPTETAARMALSEITGKALKDAHVTLFSGTPDNMPFMFTPKMQ